MTYVERARFSVRLRWQYSVKRRLSRGRRLTRRLPWRLWCRLCAWDAEQVIAEIGARANRSLTVVQIGANDGVLNDPLHATIRAQGWAGLVVEPLPGLFERLTANYSDVPGIRAVNVAIAATDGTATIYEVEGRPGDPEWVNQIASFDRDVVLVHAYAMPEIEGRIVSTEVATMTLPSLVSAEGVTSVDLLHIDAEGMDDQIIRQIDMGASWAPRFIVYENKHMSRDRYFANRDLLRAAGYTVVNLWPDELAYRSAPSASS